MKDLQASTRFPVQFRQSVKFASAALATMTVLTFGPASAWCQTTDNVLQDYKAGNYVQLLTDCDKILATEPNNAVVHYYRATAWAKMGVGIQAQAEYKTAFKLTHDPHLQQYCQTALTTLQNPSLRQASNGAVVNSGSQPGQPILPGNAPTSPVSLIEQQADSMSLAALDQAGAAHATFSQISQQADAMKKQADANANSMASQYWYDKQGHGTPVYTQAQVDAARQKGYDDAANLLTRGRIMTDAAYESAKLKAYETQATAAALESQLRNKSKGGVQLLEHGTNLFVRNYAASPGASNINSAQAYVGDDPALAATQKSLQELSQTGAHSLAKGQSKATTVVEGRLLKSGNQ
jgi:hypothetical protein